MAANSRYAIAFRLTRLYASLLPLIAIDYTLFRCKASEAASGDAPSADTARTEVHWVVKGRRNGASD